MQNDETITRREAIARGVGAAVGGLALSGVDGAIGAQPREQTMKKPLTIPAWYYRHHDADYDLDVPEEGFGGWEQASLEFSREHTAVVSMHAWDMGTRAEFPGWYRVVPYGPRANVILRDVYPTLLEAVRASGLPLFHVVGGGDYYSALPGHKRAVALAGPGPAALEQVESDPVRDKLNEYRSVRAYPAPHNTEDIRRGFARVDFPEEARPVGDEGIAENAQQLFALCKHHGINHLIYCGFAINWCLLLSPGGMSDMQKHGLMCSALRQATTAVENKESARKELCKELALWRTALSFGFVFDVPDFIAGVSG